jgi:glycogen debranching enzyme
MLSPDAAYAEWKRRVDHFERLRNTTTRVWTPSALLNRAFEWAKVNLDESMVCNPDLGCGLVAGYGLSGSASDRPGFAWFFGGDASINSFAMSPIGMGDLVRDGVFRFFAKYQRADGKITHEISQGAAKIDWFGAYPYAYYHGDTTPFWLLALGEYWKQTADTALVRELWPNIRKAYTWSRSADTDGDGLMENTVAGAGALEVGDLQIGIVSDVYLSGVWVAALERFARMAEAMGDRALVAEASTIRRKALGTLEQKLWLDGQGQYAFALLEGGRINDNLTAWPATAMAFDVFDPSRGAQMAARLAGAAIMTDWGARPLSARSSLFDPLHYNNGAVWPFVTGWVATAQYRYHNAHAGRFALDAIAATGFDEARGRNPEVISGRVYKPLDTAVPHQFFATSMVITPLIRGLLGIEVDAPAGRLTLAPNLPADWDSVRVDHLGVGKDRVSFVVRRSAHTLLAEVWRTGEDTGRPLDVVFAPALPLGAADVTTMVPGEPVVERRPGAVVVTSRARLRERLRLGVSWTGGWEVATDEPPPRIGDRSRALRVVSERLVNGRYVIEVEGRARTNYQLRLRGSQAPVAVTIEPVSAVMPPLELAPSGRDGGWHVLSFTMPANGADDDGYVGVRFVISS